MVLYSHSKKGQTWRFISGAVIFLIILALVIYILGGFGAQQAVAQSCAGINGVLAPECDESVANNLVIFDEEDRGLVCCIKKQAGVTKEEFNEWAEPYKANTASGSGGIGSVGEGVPGLDRKLHLDVNDIAIEQGMNPLIIAHNTKTTFKALNNLKEGKCLVDIRKAEQSFGTYIPIEGADPEITYPTSGNFEDCPLGKMYETANGITLLADTGKNNTIYLLTFRHKDEQEKETTIQAVLNISRRDALAQDISHLKIKTKVSATAPRNQNNHCLISAYLEDADVKSNSVLAFKVETVPEDVPCSWSGNFIKLSEEFVFTSFGSTKYCVLFADREYPRVQGTAIASASGCNVLHVIPYGMYEDAVLEGCDMFCSDFVGSNKISCYDHTARSLECAYTAHCNFVREGLFKRDCLTCDSSVVNCSSYNTRRACKANQCLPQEVCQWIPGLPGRCVTVETIEGLVGVELP